MQPYLSYILGEEVKKDTSIITTVGVEDSIQKFKVLAVGPGHIEYRELIKPDVQVGDTVYIQKHATADTPQELLDKGQALFMNNRIMGVEHA